MRYGDRGYGLLHLCIFHILFVLGEGLYIGQASLMEACDL